MACMRIIHLLIEFMIETCLFSSFLLFLARRLTNFDPVIVDGKTYARELDAAVTALGVGALLLEVKVTELATRGLDNTSDVALGVVTVSNPISGSFFHFLCWYSILNE